MVRQETGELGEVARGLTPAEGVVEMPLALIRRWRGQPRTWFDPEKLEELAADIRTRGRLLQPLRVRPDLRPNQPPGGYLITVGERRYLAARLAGLETVTVVIDAVDDTQALLDALAENMHRQDLTPDEENEAVRRLRERGLRDHEIARRLGISKSTISRLTAVFDDPVLGPRVADGRLTLTQARELLLLPSLQKEELADYLRVRQREGVPVGRTELRQLVADAMPGTTTPAPVAELGEASPVAELPLPVAPVAFLPEQGLRVEIGQGSSPPPLAPRAISGFGAAPIGSGTAPWGSPVADEDEDEDPAERELLEARRQRDRDRAYLRSKELREAVYATLEALGPYVVEPDVRANLEAMQSSLREALSIGAKAR